MLTVKRYKTAADRLSDFKLGMGVVIKADEDWRGVGRPGVKCIAIATCSSWFIFDTQTILSDDREAPVNSIPEVWFEATPIKFTQTFHLLLP